MDMSVDWTWLRQSVGPECGCRQLISIHQSKGREGQREGGGDGGDGEESVEDDGGGWSEWSASRGEGAQKLLQHPRERSLLGRWWLAADRKESSAPGGRGGHQPAAAVLLEDASSMEYDRCFDEEVAHKVRGFAMWPM